MSLIVEYTKIREVSRKMNIFQKNIGRKVYLHIKGGYKYLVEPVEVKGKEFFFKLIGNGLDEHPLVSHPIENIERIIPMA